MLVFLSSPVVAYNMTSNIDHINKMHTTQATMTATANDISSITDYL